MSLGDRVLAQLRTLPPGRRVTAATLTGWLSVSADPRDVAASLERLKTERQAQVWRSKGTADLWAVA